MNIWKSEEYVGNQPYYNAYNGFSCLKIYLYLLVIKHGSTVDAKKLRMQEYAAWQTI